MGTSLSRHGGNKDGAPSSESGTLSPSPKQAQSPFSGDQVNNRTDPLHVGRSYGNQAAVQMLEENSDQTSHPGADGASGDLADSAERAATPVGVQDLAAAGLRGATDPLPHRSSIQDAFGKHDVSGIRAQVGGAAADAASSMGAEAYAMGNGVGFRSSPDLHTAAHEAAHVVQQRGGIQLSERGRSGDVYEQHAEAVADRVQEGGSAQSLLDRFAAGSSSSATGSSAPVQMSEQVATAEAGAAVAPTGPLAQLREELDDIFVNEGDCLTYMGQLGTGERQLVRQDTTMMRQICASFDGEEMLRAVDLLNFPLKWAVYWIGEAGEAGSIGDAGYARLLGSAPSQELAEMVGWDSVRELVRANYSASPLSFPGLVQDPARMRHVIQTYPAFTDWVIERAGSDAMIRYAAANSPADTLAALRGANKLNTLLDASAAAGNAASISADLFTLFQASQVPAERARIFSIRFGQRTSTDFDWMANGVTHWNNTASATGESATDAQIAADIAAGNGPTTVDQAVTADQGGPLEQLRDELDDVFVDEAACLQNLASLNARERYLVRADATLMGQMAGAFSAQEMISALRTLAFPDPKWAIHWLDESGEAGSASRQDYESLIFPATAQKIAELVGWRAVFDVVKDNSGIDSLAIPPLVASDATMANIIQTHPYFVDWALEMPGAQMLLRYVANHTPATMAPAIKSANRLSNLVDALPVGSSLAPDDQQAMLTVCRNLPDIADKILLFQRRFNIQVGSENGAVFDTLGLEQIWILLERLPPRLLADNAWLENLNRTGTAGTSNGVTGGNRVGVGYDQSNLGALDVGVFTDAGDVMANTNIFDAVVIHEMGHAADRQHGFSSASGPLATRDDLGAWQHYPNGSQADCETLLDAMLAGNGLGSLHLTADQTAKAREGFIATLSAKSADAEAQFQAKAAAAGETWAAGNSWFDTWDKVKNHTIVNVLANGHLSRRAWNTPPPAMGDRTFHQAYSHRWASYLTAFRAGQKLSRYQFRDRGEFFAETYATYYLTPNNPGQLVQAWNNTVYQWFTREVDAGFSTRVTP